LRRDATKAEKKLWYFLQRKQMGDVSFRRQHPLGKYFIDFYCPPLRLAIEVDGGQHNSARIGAQDKRRTLSLETRGMTVLRFWNNEVLENIEGVWTEIAKAVAVLNSRHATLPLSGGGNFGEVDR
jgi:very-short-patch-repair endonuclease